MQKDTKKELERFLHSFSDFFRAYRDLFALFYDDTEISYFIPFVSTISSDRIIEDSVSGFPYTMPRCFSLSPCSIDSVVRNVREPVYKVPPEVLTDGSRMYTNKGGNKFIVPPAGSAAKGEIRTHSKVLPIGRLSEVSDDASKCFRKYLFNAFPVMNCLQQLPRIIIELFLLIEETADLDVLQEVMEGIGLSSPKQSAAKMRIQNLMKKKAVSSKDGYGGKQYAITEAGAKEIPKFFSDNELVFAPLGISIPESLDDLCDDAFSSISASYAYRSRHGQSLHQIREARVYARLLLSPSGYGMEHIDLSLEDSAADDASARTKFRKRYHGTTAGTYADISEVIYLSPGDRGDDIRVGGVLRRQYKKRTLAYEIDNGTEQLELTPGSRIRQKDLDERQAALAVTYNGERAYVGDNAIDECSTISGKVRNYVRVFSRDKAQGDIVFIPFETSEELAAKSGTGNREPSIVGGKGTPPAKEHTSKGSDGGKLLPSIKREGWRDISSSILLRGFYLAAGGFAGENFQDGFPDSGLINNITCAELLRYLGKIADELGTALGVDETDPGSVEAVSSLDMDSYHGILDMRRVLSEYLQHYGGKSLQDKSRKPLSDFFRFITEQSGDSRGKEPVLVKSESTQASAKPSRGGFASRSRAQNILRVLLKGSASAEIRLGINNGLSVSAVLPSRISELFFVTPERWFGKSGIIAAVKSLGLIPEEHAGDTMLSYHTPLALDRGDPGFVTRLCLWNDHVRIAIENISADIGGFVRARNYMSSFPAGIGSRTVMLMLVNDSLTLADGSSLLDGTMLRDPGNHNIRYVDTAGLTGPSSPAAEMDYYFDMSDKIVGQLPEEVCEAIGGGAADKFFRHVPLLHGIDRDYMMVTYSDFMRAVIGEDVEAFSIFSRKKAFVRTGDFPEGRLPKPFRKAAGSVRAKEYDMSSLLADVH